MYTNIQIKVCIANVFLPSMRTARFGCFVRAHWTSMHTYMYMYTNSSVACRTQKCTWVNIIVRKIALQRCFSYKVIENLLFEYTRISGVRLSTQSCISITLRLRHWPMQLATTEYSSNSRCPTVKVVGDTNRGQWGGGSWGWRDTHVCACTITSCSSNISTQVTNAAMQRWWRGVRLCCFRYDVTRDADDVTSQ